MSALCCRSWMNLEAAVHCHGAGSRPGGRVTFCWPKKSPKMPVQTVRHDPAVNPFLPRAPRLAGSNRDGREDLGRFNPLPTHCRTLHGCSTAWHDAHATVVVQRRARAGCGARGWRRRAQGSWPRASARFGKHTRRHCLTRASAASGGSLPAGHEPEHRRAVGAQRRPPPSCAAARPGAPLPH